MIDPRNRFIPFFFPALLRHLGGTIGLTVLLCWLALVVVPVPALAQRQMETLGRGMIVVRATSTQAYIGWRLLGDDPAGIAFNLYRSANGAAAVKLNPSPLTASTNFTDSSATFTVSNSYFVRPVVGGVEQAAGATFTLPANTAVQNYLNLPLQIPQGGTNASGAYTYTANDASVGDLDGDGEYEIILKWDPTNAKDNSQSGYTGVTYLDAYRLDGTLLWRIDLGVNIRSGAHYMDFMVYDFDGDGRAELMCRTAPGSLDGNGAYVGGAAKWQGGARPAFVDDDDYRNTGGYILYGPEFLSVFDGLTGAELATTRFVPQRDPDNQIDNPSSSRLTTLWGDGYGNRFDRFLAAVAYVDGQRPTGIFARGYYTRTFLTAWDWRGGQLTRRWTFDSGTGPTSNRDYAGQGAHSISVGDLDGDGKDEIAYGACAIDDNGTGLWTSKLGHGDATHLSEMDPDRPGLKFFMPHESPSSYGIYGTSITEQRDGTVLSGVPGGGDVGRGVAFDIDPRYPGYENWATNSSSVYTVKGVPITTSARPAVNFGVWWDADPLRELLDSNRISKWVPASANTTGLLTMSGTSSINGTKATPNLSGDILGDWREEIVMRSTDNAALRIYTTTNEASTRLYTLMHDPQYREAIAWQNTGYNQPPHPGFFLGQDMAEPPRAPIWRGNLVWKGASGANTWDAGGSARWLRAGAASTFITGTDSVLLDYTGDTSSALTLTGTLSPAEVIVHNARNKDYTLSGSGTLAGPMTLTKAGIGALTLQSAHAYTGPTRVQQGDLNINGTLSASPVTVQGLGRVAGTGTLGNGLTLAARGRIAPGAPASATGTLSVQNALNLTSAVLELDLGATPAAARDQIVVTGNLVLAGTNRIDLRLLGGTLAPGSYPLITYSGTLSGTVANFTLTGLAGAPGTLALSGGALVLNVAATRAPDALVWRGAGSTWDLATSQNWLLGGAASTFVTGDAVRLDATGASALTVSLATELFPAAVTVDAAANYTLSGPGLIGGSGGLTKAGTGTLTVQTDNSYTGPTTLNGGILSVASVSASGIPGPLGAATANAANFVLNGGTLRYTAALNFSTNRGATLAAGGGTVEVSTSAASLVWAGPIAGAGVLTKTGPGTLNLAGINAYSGGTVIQAGTVLLGSFAANEDGLGTGLVTLAGGTLSMTDLQSNNSCAWDLLVPAGSSGRLNADGRCTLSGTLTGAGTFTFYTPFSRTGLNGNWSAFTGQISVRTDGDGGDFRINNNFGYANATLDLANLVYLYSLTGSTQLGALTGTTGAVLSGTAWTIGAKNVDSTFAGTITGNSLVKVGTGTLTLAPSKTTSLATTTTAGSASVTLVSTTGLVAQMPVTGTGIPTGTRIASVASATALTLTKAATASGSPSLTYSNINTYTGNTTVSAGALVVDGVLGSSAVTVNPGAALGGGGVFAGPVTFQSGSTLLARGSAGGPVFAGTLTFNGVVNVKPAGTSALPNGTYPLFTYTGSLVGTPNFSWSGPGYSATFNTATAGVVSMTLTRIPAALVWTGAASAAWNTSALNWKFASSATATSFLSQDTVRFDDTRTGNAAVTLAGPLTPASVTVDNTTAYSFASSAGGLAGGAALTKTGTGTLTLTGANTFTGGVTLNAGTLVLGDEAANLSGLGTGPLTLEGGTLQQLDGSGTASATTYDLRVPLGANPTLRADSRLNLSGPLTGAGTLNLYVPGLQFTVLGNWSAFTGRIQATTDATGGLLRLANTAAVPLAGVDLGSKVTLVSFLNQNQTLALGALSGASDAALSGIVIDSTTPGAHTLTWQVGGLGLDSAFAGTVTDGTSPSRTALTKVGAGTQTFTGAGTYTGPTIISGGTLVWGGTLTNSSTVEVLAGATLRLTGTLNVASVTVRAGGTLTGGGVITGTLINEGTWIADGGTSAWTINGAVTNSATGTIRFTRGATLAVSAGLANAGTLDLITAGAIPGGVTGAGPVLTAASVIAPSIATSGDSDLQIALPTHVGHQYQLQRCADLAIGDWQNVGAPQSGTGGSLSFIDTPAVGAPRVFYRVIVSP